MSPDTPVCPPPEVIDAIAMGDSVANTVAAHIARCARCAQRIELARFERLFAQVLADRADGAASDGSAHLEVFGYRILGEIARGGQGVVYRAEQKTTGRLVAIKALHHALSARSRRNRERFAREIRIAGALDHPGIVRLFDSVKIADGRDALIMELIEGDALDIWIQRRPRRDPASILECLADIADATHHAHQRGVIHRDLKPSNILIDRQGAPRLLDFGVAALTEPEPDGIRVTQMGDFTGTLAYAAPEQVAGDAPPPDIRTDIYALGVIGFECLTGTLPYDTTGSLENAVAAIVRAPPPPSTASGIARDHWTVLAKAMAKDPERRYASAADFARDLRRAARGAAIDARRDSRWYRIRKTAARHKLALTLVSTAAVALIVSAVSLALANARLANALRESRVMQIDTLLNAGSRAQAERMLWPEIDRTIPPDADPARVLWSGAPEQCELLWRFVQMQASATCLATAEHIAASTTCLWALEDGTFVLLTSERRLDRLAVTDDRLVISRGVELTANGVPIGVTPSGRYAVLRDGASVRTVDVRTGDVLASVDMPPEYDSPSLSTALAEWGIVLAAEDFDIRVLSLPDLRPVWTSSDLHRSQTPWLDPYAPILAAITRTGDVRVIDLRTGERVPPSGARVFADGRPARFARIMLTPDRTRIVVAHGGGLLMRNLTASPYEPEIQSRPGYRISAAHDPTWTFITATATGDPTLHFWNASDGAQLPGIPGHHGAVVAHAFTPDASRVITADTAGTLRLWTTPGQTWRTPLSRPTTLAHQIAVDPRAGDVYATDAVGRVWVHPLHGTDASLLLDPAEPRDPFTRIAVTQDAGRVALATMRGAIAIIAPQASEGSPPNPIERPSSGSIAGMRFRPSDDRPQLAIALASGLVALIDADAPPPPDGSESAVWTIHLRSRAETSDLAWSDDGRFIGVALRDGRVAVIDAAVTPPTLVMHDLGAGHLRALVFVPGAHRIAAVGESGRLHLLDLRSGTTSASEPLTAFSLFCIAFAPGGRIAFLGDRAGAVRAVDADTLKELATFDAGGSVMALEPAEQGRSLIVAALDRPTERWAFADLVETMPAIRPATHRKRSPAPPLKLEPVATLDPR